MLTFYYLCMNITYVSFCVLFFALQHIPEIIYTKILKRQFNPYAFKNLWDFAMFCLFMTYIWVTYYGNLHGTWKEQGYLRTEYRAQVYAVNFTQNNP